MTSRTMYITQEGPANALAPNKDYSQVVIAGRNGNNFIINVLHYHSSNIISS